ncbi:hypothetical protein ScPMuIL_002643 [Solemya velum]
MFATSNHGDSSTRKLELTDTAIKIRKMDVILIKVMCVLMLLAMVDSGPVECRRRYSSCMRLRKTEPYCRRKQHNCLLKYCLVLSNKVKRKSLVTLVSCYVRHGIPTQLWNSSLD